MSTQILDVYCDNRVNWQNEKNTGTDGVLIKGGQGSFQEYFYRKCTFIDQAKAVDMPYGIFWQMDARISPEDHKAALKNSFPTGNFGQLGLWLACELPYYPCPDWLYWRMPYAGYKTVESVWRGMFAAFGVYPGIYCSISKWDLIFGKCPLSLQQEFAAKSALWQAQYKVTAPDKFGAWPSWDLWQYTENPDYSVASDAWWTKVMGATPPAPAPTPTPSPVNTHLHFEKTITVDIDTLDANTAVSVKMLP